MPPAITKRPPSIRERPSFGRNAQEERTRATPTTLLHCVKLALCCVVQRDHCRTQRACRSRNIDLVNFDALMLSCMWQTERHPRGGTVSGGIAQDRVGERVWVLPTRFQSTLATSVSAGAASDIA